MLSVSKVRPPRYYGATLRGFGGLVLLVLVVGTIIRNAWVIALVAGIVLLGFLLYRFVRWVDRRCEARAFKRRAAADQLAAIARRADQQHTQVLAGDDRGIYGDDPPKQIA
jgi:hypothetical protein